MVVSSIAGRFCSCAAAAAVLFLLTTQPIHAFAAFGPHNHPRHSTTSLQNRKFFPTPGFPRRTLQPETSQPPKIQRWWNNISDPLHSAGFNKDEVLTAGGLPDKIKSLHNPKLYLGLCAAAMLKWKGLFRNPYYWFVVAFCVKWYRARYIFKIPVWDRQPNWNNVVTSKEQEKDLKAFTCKTCGSTLFIAKSREFFFEGGTGLKGLGCFSCGAKGEDNFVMDRDRIVEDVADMDDYFEYERPLDFVSAAEQKKILRETGGDEEKANQILMERANAEAAEAGLEVPASETESTTTSVVDEESSSSSSAEKNALPETMDSSVAEKEAPPAVPSEQLPPPPPSASAPAAKTKPSPPPKKFSDDGLDALGMDDL